MSLGCARCGSCCDPVHLDPSNRALIDGCRDGTKIAAPGGSAEFILAHWTEIERRDTGATYSCDRYDPDTRACTAHEDRPPVCRNYPWYDDDTDPEALRKRAPQVNRCCSFLLDVPPADRGPDARPLIPVTVVRSTP